MIPRGHGAPVWATGKLQAKNSKWGVRLHAVHQCSPCGMAACLSPQQQYKAGSKEDGRFNNKLLN